MVPITPKLNTTPSMAILLPLSSGLFQRTNPKITASEKPIKATTPLPGSSQVKAVPNPQNPHVYTLGKSGDEGHLLKGMAELSNIDAEFIEIDRGGDITYHGPGQLVGYPILDLDRHFTDIHKYLRYLEEVMIRTCSEYGIEAGRIEGLTGVWVENKKICAMGIRCSRWVTMHGFAFNVNVDLSYFNHIVPCGISDKEVTSLEELLGHKVNESQVKEHLLTHFRDVFDVSVAKVDSLPELDDQFSYLKKSGKKAASQ
jgi:lipoyl(octanoyl) transferase